MNVSHTISFLQEKCQISSHDPICIGVSGGADSLCLLHLLHTAGWRVFIFHLNHSIRAEAGHDARFVAEYCKNLGVPYSIQTADVPAEAERSHLSIEEAARVVRYRLMFGYAREIGAKALLTAHHAGDQAETILMHFIRGTGLDGLRGMRPVAYLPEYDQTIPLIRPLLDVTRSEIETYCAENQIRYVTDASNSDPTYFRNWLRNELIPQIEGHNPRFQSNLGQMGEILAGDAELCDELSRQAFTSCLRERQPGALMFDRNGWGGYPIALQRRLARLAIGELRPYFRDIDFEMVERMRGFFTFPPDTRHLDLGAGCELDFLGEQVCLHIAFVEPPVSGYPQLEREMEGIGNGTVDMAARWRLTVKADSPVEPAWQSAHVYEAWLDQERLALPLTIRTRRPGDRMRPLGMGGHTSKVADLLINHKIPSAARRQYPLVCDAAGEVVWLPGICVSQAAAISLHTTRCVHLTVSNAGV